VDERVILSPDTRRAPLAMIACRCQAAVWVEMTPVERVLAVVGVVAGGRWFEVSRFNAMQVKGEHDVAP
jgi:hypothetical protein